jgi:hypothetical protein
MSIVAEKEMRKLRGTAGTSESLTHHDGVRAQQHFVDAGHERVDARVRHQRHGNVVVRRLIEGGEDL